MLANKLALSLPSTNVSIIPFDPIDESSLLAWYKNKTGITQSIGRVSEWLDSSTNSYDMQQPTTIERPAYDTSTGKLTFNPSSDQSLQSPFSTMSITGEFTIGFKINVGVSGEGTVLASNTTSDRYISIKAGGTILLIHTDTGGEYSLNLNALQSFTNADVVLSRDSSNLVRIYLNGNLQTDKATISGRLEINAIGIRLATNTLPFDGWMSEIQIYNSTSSTLISNVNTYLSNI
tara:strand:+ start:76 stop:777 length:702 start_codon:yes stop_codon:yes gene_type:complete